MVQLDCGRGGQGCCNALVLLARLSICGGLTMVSIDTKIELSLREFVAFTFFAGSKTGQKYIYESGKLATSYAAKQLQLTGRMFLAEPAKAVAKKTATKAAKAAVVRASPPVTALVVGGIAFNAIGNTRAVQQVGHIGNVGALGMGGTF